MKYFIAKILGIVPLTFQMLIFFVYFFLDCDLLVFTCVCVCVFVCLVFFQAEWLYGGESSASIEVYEHSSSHHC